MRCGGYALDAPPYQQLFRCTVEAVCFLDESLCRAVCFGGWSAGVEFECAEGEWLEPVYGDFFDASVPEAAHTA